MLPLDIGCMSRITVSSWFVPFCPDRWWWEVHLINSFSLLHMIVQVAFFVTSWTVVVCHGLTHGACPSFPISHNAQCTSYEVFDENLDLVAGEVNCFS
jgi:hypothetical protein